MRGFMVVMFAAVAGLCFTATAPKAEAQVTVSIGVAPDCPYGYYDVAPYDCAPYGYYGPEWFTGTCLHWRRPVVSWPQRLPRQRR